MAEVEARAMVFLLRFLAQADDDEDRPAFRRRLERLVGGDREPGLARFARNLPMLLGLEE